ncbi:non-SMC mitotic condensation complex subunit 1 [Dichotomocladium elegans]|nr:non-SMC mitotic condensation complex subunit 1 [Dichotomocladium elegans]
MTSPIASKNFQHISPRISAKLHDIIISAFRAEIKATSEDLENDERDSFTGHKYNLELYVFILHWLLVLSSERSALSAGQAVTTKAKKGRSRVSDETQRYDWSAQKLKTFELFAKLLEHKLSKIWPLKPEREVFISLFTKPAFQIFENPAAIKATATATPVKRQAFKVLALSIKYYDQMFPAQTTIIQNLQYWEHSAEPMVELLHLLIDKYDYSQLADEILREISNKEFKDISTKEVKDSPNPKTFATFLVKLAEVAPKCIQKNLGLLINQLGSEIAPRKRSKSTAILTYWKRGC